MRHMEKKANRLIREKSPYLLQHAHNPVDWFPFGDDAFEQAKREDKPVFLSIGYATCHWCHVMERESFEDDEVASLMNQSFVSIKVDREERPDIDHIYMTVCQMMTGGGGWPLTILLTPDKRPFFAATYIPKSQAFGRKGMLELIPEIDAVWESQRAQIEASANRIATGLSSIAAIAPGNYPDEEAFHLTFNALKKNFDPVYGGFGFGMKFPTPHQLLFLMRYHRRYQDTHAKEMVFKTLDAMANGGIRDHIGFGFHRYATDREWRVPHFEKMLYDQALLLIAYSEAYGLSGNERYKEVAEQIGCYVQRDMTDSGGGFYSAEDADSEGVEGKFYLWTRDEIHQTLDAADATAFIETYNVSKTGNFAEESGIEGANILFLNNDEPSTPPAADVARIRESLFSARQNRAHPLKDDKILTDWNGLMIAAFAIAGRQCDRPDFIDSASNAAGFIAKHLTDERKGIHHRFREAEAGLPAHLDDYAAYLLGLVELYQATLDIQLLERADSLAKQMISKFSDPEGGAFFLTANTTETILVRPKESYDGALPSGNALAFISLIKLARMTSNTDFETAATHIAKGVAPYFSQSPSGHTMFMTGLDFAIGPSIELVIVGGLEETQTREMINTAHSSRLSNLSVLLKTDDNDDLLAQIAPFTKAHKMKAGVPTAYVCVDHACSPPVTNSSELKQLLIGANQ